MFRVVVRSSLVNGNDYMRQMTFSRTKETSQPHAGTSRLTHRHTHTRTQTDERARAHFACGDGIMIYECGASNRPDEFILFRIYSSDKLSCCSASVAYIGWLMATRLHIKIEF